MKKRCVKIVKKLSLEDESEKKNVNSLGLEVSESRYKINSGLGVMGVFEDTVESNPAFAMALILSVILALYALSVFDSLVIFHYLAIILSYFIMFWVSLVEDARTGYKLSSISLIFMAIIIFISLK